MSRATDIAEICLEAGMTRLEALQQVAPHVFTVGQAFDALVQAGYQGITPDRTPHELDGTQRCPECNLRSTWYSSLGDGTFYCRECVLHFQPEIYHENH